MEQKMTTEERAFVASKIKESKLIAYYLGERMAEATNDIGISVHASCILFASICAINDISPENANELFENMYMQIVEAMKLMDGTLQ